MMSFKEGFEAIDRIRASGQALGALVERIEALSQDLEELRRSQAGLEALLAQVKAVFGAIEKASNSLSSQEVEFTRLAEHLPTLTDDVLASAEERLLAQQNTFSQLAQKMPEMVEKAVEAKLNLIANQLEARISDRLRDELKDTRAAIRDALEVNARSHEAKLETARKEILAEMPRTIFGRRGG